MTEDNLNFKFGIPGPKPSAYHYPRHFEIEPNRLVIGLQENAIRIINLLKQNLPEPFAILYVLNVPRDEEILPGRYQSPWLTHTELNEFLTTFQSFIEGDARHEIWVYSEPSKTQIVYDFHNLIYYYSPDLNPAILSLKSIGFLPGKVEIPFPHIHPYHPHFDPTLADLMNYFDWNFTPHPEDHEP
ncbi:hypothetical protein C0431_06245 [bacterium]|nr:hypothetical protein [bacterium]